MYTQSSEVTTVFQYAQEESSRRNHNYVGREHVLLGLLKLNAGIFPDIIKATLLSTDAVRQEIEKLMDYTGSKSDNLSRPLTPPLKKVLSFAEEEASNLDSSIIGVEHILLGMLRNRDGIAGRVFCTFGMNHENIFYIITRLLKCNNITPVEGADLNWELYYRSAKNKFNELKKILQDLDSGNLDQSMAIMKIREIKMV